MVDFRWWLHTNTFSHERFRWLRKPTPDLFRIAVVGAADYANSADLVRDVALSNCRGTLSQKQDQFPSFLSKRPTRAIIATVGRASRFVPFEHLVFDISNQRLRPPLRGQRFLELAEFA